MTKIRNPKLCLVIEYFEIGITWEIVRHLPLPPAGEGGGEGEHILSTPTLVLPRQGGG
jgi:hypothetical protein